MNVLINIFLMDLLHCLPTRMLVKLDGIMGERKISDKYFLALYVFPISSYYERTRKTTIILLMVVVRRISLSTTK